MPLKIRTSPTQFMYKFLTIIRTNRKHLPTALVKWSSMYRGADKSLAQPGRKQATATEDFDFHKSYL